MQSVFLSYSYNPHLDFVAETTQLVTASRIVIELLDLRMSDGVDLGARVDTTNDACEYQLLAVGFEPTSWQPAKL